jgi:hypothetical protein
MTKALIISADGTAPVIKEVAEGASYDAIKEAVRSHTGDFFDCVRGESFHGYVNDTGLIDGLPLNPVASIIFGQVICGDAILFGSYNPQGKYDGEEYDIPVWVAESARQQWFLWKENADAQMRLEETQSRLAELGGGVG